MLCLQLILLDFGASREFPKKFVDDYIRIIKAAADDDREGVLEWSQSTGFLTGYETKVETSYH
jgi:aarF domain-containing kinase